MDIGDIISDSIKYPSSRLGKGAYFGNYIDNSILIVPIFLVYGYILE